MKEKKNEVEKVATNISSLLASGIQFSSSAPEYYYTKIDDLKLEIIEKATQSNNYYVEDAVEQLLMIAKKND